MRRWKRRTLRALAVALLQPLAAAASAGPSHAQGEPPPAVSITAAESLFQDAKTALEDGRVAEACAKLAESHRLDPAGGTVLLLALCREREGKLASAWTNFHEALALARRDGRADRAERAIERIEHLGPRLVRLVVEVRHDASELEVRLDGVAWPTATWGTTVPIDAGVHRVEASAAGRRTFATEFTADEPGTLRVDVPELEPLPVFAPPPPPPPSTTRRTWGFVALGAGALSLVGGAAAGTAALAFDSSADARCPERDCADARAVEDSRRAATAASIANVALAIGVALGATGAVLLLVSSKGQTSTPAHAALHGVRF